MATTFTLTSNSYDGRYLTLTCTQTANASNNTSTINWTLTVAGGNSNYYSTGPTTVTIGGTKVYEKARVSYTTQTFPAAKGSTSGSLTVNHNSDGSKSLAVSLSTAIYNTAIDTKSGTWTLDSNGRTSTATVSSAYIGDWANCVISAANTSYTHDVSFTCLNKSTTIGTGLRGGSHTFSIPTSYYDVFGTRERATATGTCKTYSGSTLIGTTTFTFIIYAQTGSDAAPTLVVEAYDTNETTINLTGDETVIIPDYSDIYYRVSATAKNGATISSYRVTNGSTVKASASGTFYGATSKTVTFQVTDSRGNVAQEVIELDSVRYVPLTCNLKTTNLSMGGNIDITISGNYFNGDFGYYFNTLSVYYRYKKDTGSYGNWTAISATRSGNTYTATQSLTGLDPEATYTFQARAVDKLSDTTSGGNNVQNKPVFDWSDMDFNFNVPVNFSAGATGLEGIGGGIVDGKYEGDLNITGDLRLKGSGNYGNTLYFGDSDYAYIKEVTDDELTICANEIILNGDVTLTETNGNPEGGAIMSGEWTPKLSSDAVNSYTLRKGWYQIVGKTAVIGFNINAIIDSGYHSEQIQISGFPFDLDYAASGGGVAYNTYVTGGFTFGCWIMNESGVITGRIVPCNNTSAGNLSISSNVCFPTGGGSITLNGTICAHVIVE